MSQSRTRALTYGRHKQRVVKDDGFDVFGSREEKLNVFSFSSESSINDVSVESNSSAKQPAVLLGLPAAGRRKQTKKNVCCKTSTRGKHNKENNDIDTTERRQNRRCKVKKTYTLSSSSDDSCSSNNSGVMFVSEVQPPTRKALKDRNAVINDISLEDNNKKTKGTKAAKKKPSTKTIKNDKVKPTKAKLNVKTSKSKEVEKLLEEGQSLETGKNRRVKRNVIPSVNFSEFSSYSLIISESSNATEELIIEPDIEPTGTPHGGTPNEGTPHMKTRTTRKNTSAVTSTPHQQAVTIHKALTKDPKLSKVHELSVIDLVESSPETSHIGLNHSKNSSEHSPINLSKSREHINDVELSLQNLCISSIAESPYFTPKTRKTNAILNTNSANGIVDKLKPCRVILDKIPSDSSSPTSSKSTSSDSCKNTLENVTVRGRRTRSNKGSSASSSSSSNDDYYDPSRDLFSDMTYDEILQQISEEDEEEGGASEEESDEDSEPEIEELSDIVEDEELEVSDIEENEVEDEEDDVSDEEDISEEQSEDDIKEESDILENDVDVTRYMISELCLDDTETSAMSSYHTATQALESPANQVQESPFRGFSEHDSHTASESLRARQLELEASCRSFAEMMTPKRTKTPACPAFSPHTKIMGQCRQEGFISFSQCITPSLLKTCVKIGEGVYGEVFRALNSRKQPVVFKVIPIEGDFTVNDEPQKTFEEILPEIVISRELSELRSCSTNQTDVFCQVNSVACVQGCYPDRLLNQWDTFNETKHSENDRPDVFSDEQLFIVFEFGDGGSDLEHFQFRDALQAKSLLHQVTAALATAELEFQFEHRDLHWGNVLVRNTTAPSVRYKIDGETVEVESLGVHACIIDFTLSRMRKDGVTVFTDLSTDESLFEGKGDHQFDVYRMMRDENENDWEPHHSFSNVLWIQYLADKLIKMKSYPDSKSRDHKSIMRDFRNFHRECLDFQSALHLLKESPFFQS
ncbi:unnamed protein product [Owenia fusiformis]|uniref:non-specific serine/threonine protein kinase n=1 Tax=Owenia fusiformis TaxID=6347 RepID=A0A8J1XEZ1_OWEFU|nr:unnamed protein product [Owenia fusiformis]